MMTKMTSLICLLLVALLGLTATPVMGADVSGCNVCTKSMLIKKDCTGFTVANNDYFDEFEVIRTGDDGKPECVDADETDDYSKNFLCCTDDESVCCEDYTTGLYIGFGIGLAAIALLVCVAGKACLTSGGDDDKEAA